MDAFITGLDIAWKLIFIFFFFGFCIFIHEFGHMLAALWCGLVVERFSIGLGSPICKLFTWRGIDFVLSWVPFGGYVALPQLDAGGDSSKDDDTPKLEPCKPIPRAIVAFAGPFFNILFGFVLATIMWCAGLYEAPIANSCIVGDVPQSLPQYNDKLKITDVVLTVNGESTDKFLEEICRDQEPGKTYDVTIKKGDKTAEASFVSISNPEWEAGLRKGDRITAVNGKAFTRGYDEFSTEYVYSGGFEVKLSGIRDGVPFELSYTPLPNPLMENLGAPFFSAYNPIAIGGVQENTPAAKAGLKPGDQLLQLNNSNILSGKHFVECLNAMNGAPFNLLVGRNGTEITMENVTCPAPCTLKDFGATFSVIVANSIKGMPAYKAGLRKGDRIVRVDDQDILDSKQLTEYIRGTKGRPMNIGILRGTKAMEFKNVASEEHELDGNKTYIIGVSLSDSTPKVIGHPSPWKQFDKILRQTGRTISLLFSPITSKVTGREHGKATIKVEHMSGALGILAMMWYTLESEGLRGGFALIILITFSLALMNLLPIPALDGCYILFSAIELIIRRRLPPKLVNILVSAFFYLLLFLIVYITFFDGRRIFRLFKTGSSKGIPARVEKSVPGQEQSAENPGEQSSTEQ